MADSGAFVVAWQSYVPLSGDYRVRARRFSSTGVGLSTEFQVNTYTGNYTTDPSAVSIADGDFVVVWASKGQDGDDWGVFARRYSSAGAATTGEIQINTYSTANQSQQEAVRLPDGGFVVAWTSYLQDGDSAGIFARRFTSVGDAVGAEFQVNTYTSGSQILPAIAIGPAGDFVVVWATNIQTVSVRRFSSLGAALTGEFQVNLNTTGGAFNPGVVVAPSGDFVVTWDGSYNDGSEGGVVARRFSSAGAPLTAEIQINAYTSNAQSSPAIAGRDDGVFVVAWQSVGQDSSGTGTFARAFSGAVEPRSSDLQVNTHTPPRVSSTRRSAAHPPVPNSSSPG